MRRLVVHTFLTLDGVMQAPGGPEEDPSGGFTHGGWSVGYWDGELMPAAMDAAVGRLDALLLGRRTYEIFAAHWPNVSGDPLADAFNRVPKHVASTTLETASWSNSTVLGEDVPGEVRRLKGERDGEIQVHGSWGLIRTLLAHDLVDVFRLMTFPVVVGAGKRLFGDGTVPAGFELTEHAVTSTGVVVATYEKAGGIAYGSFALEEPAGETRRRESHVSGR